MINKHTLRLAFASGIVAFSASAAPIALKVNLQNGSSPAFILAEKPVVKFSGSDMVISTPETETRFERSEIRNLVFTETASIINLDNLSGDRIQYLDQVLSSPGNEIFLYDISGNLMNQSMDELNMKSYPDGIYIVKAGNTSLKIKK